MDWHKLFCRELEVTFTLNLNGTPSVNFINIDYFIFQKKKVTYYS